MSISFTPGPWIRHPIMAWVASAADMDGLPVCELCVKRDGVDCEQEALANARLISASPDLLAALQFAVDHLTADTFTGDELGDFYEQARAAIAKATTS